MQNDPINVLYSFAVIRSHCASAKAIVGNTSEFCSVSDDKTLKIWKIDKTKQFVASCMFRDERSLFLSSVAYSQDESCCIFSSLLEREEEDDCDLKWLESRIYVCFIQNQNFYQIGCISDMNFVLCVCFLHCVDYVAYGCDDGSVNIFRKTKRKEKVVFERYQTLRKQKRGILAIAFCHETKLLVATSHDATAFVWRLDENIKFKSVKSLVKHSNSVCGVAFSKTSFATISYDGTFCVWSKNTLDCIAYEQYNCVLKSVAAFPHDESFVCGTRDGRLIFWHKDYTVIKEIALTARSVECISFLKSQTDESMDCLIFGARDNKIRVCKITQKLNVPDFVLF